MEPLYKKAPLKKMEWVGNTGILPNRLLLTFNKKAALAKRAFDESDKFQGCLRKVGFTKFNELSVVGSVCFSDLISGKFDTPELILSANEPWQAANSKSYENLALKHWCIAKSDFRGNLTSEPFIDVRGKSKFCGSSKKFAHQFQQIPYQAVKKFFSQESQKQTLCSRVKPLPLMKKLLL